MWTRFGALAGGIACALFLLAAASSASSAEPVKAPASGESDAVDFRSDVQPIFRRHCYECHGPDKRKGGLRLSNRNDAFVAGDLGIPVIEPERPDLSPLYELITSEDPEERMPKKKAPLAPEQIERIRRWIEAGAPWPAEADEPETHWAYRKPVRPELPAVRDASWPRNEIDRFVLARLEAEGIAPAPEADRVTLARRIHLDLTGLPPTPEQIDAFVADESPDAYERLVDRLLASPHFGEKWARLWLDAARYADSTGFQSDQLRPNWAYRDWVIDALNEDMPYDRFTIEQLAGDLLPGATIDQRIATGFQRSAPLSLEAGTHAEESRVGQVMDRVNTTGTLWLGSTIECAQCHDHKYDPFSQEEYYRLLAYFNNTPDETLAISGVALMPGGPEIDLPLSDDMREERDRLVERLRAILEREKALTPSKFPPQMRLEQIVAAIERGNTAAAMDLTLPLSRVLAKRIPARDFEAWVKRAEAAVDAGAPHWRPLPITHFDGSGGERVRRLPDESILVEGPTPDISTYVIRVRAEGSGFTAFKIEALRDESLPGKGPGRSDEENPEFVLSEIEIARQDAGGEPVRLPLYGPLASHENKTGRIRKAIDGKLDTGWSIAELYTNHWAVFRVDEPLAADGPYDLVFTLHQNAGFGKTIGRLRILATTDPTEIAGFPPDVVALLRLKERSRDETRRLRKFFDSTRVEGELRKELDAILRELPTYQVTRAPVMEELPEKRETHLMKRGNYLDPGEEVSPGTPAVLHPMAPDLPRNRLGLARWLVDPANPLVGRATVNRWWGELFGQGLVATPEDFGTQGDLPTHPELLDWLAVELVENGWSRKHMVRKMVTSATYRQSSRPASPETLERDPENDLLARNPRLRLPAELVRDNALAIAGLLSSKMGGPAVYPPQPEGIWNLTGGFQPVYNESRGEDRYRRGIYAIWRRSSPYPSFVNFDAKDRTACVLRRSRTDTPLQALTLLNDEVYVEAALGLAERILEERTNGSSAERARYGFRLAVGREPTAAEVSELEKLLASQRERLRARGAIADDLFASIPSYEPAAGVSREELAAWYFVASTLLNLDETITRG